MAFRCGAEERRVDLSAPFAVERGGRPFVPLIDLWVASGLPGDFLDLAFEIVTHDPAGAAPGPVTLDPQRFARGLVAVDDCQLWWDDPAEGALHGLWARSIVVHRARVAAPPALVERDLPARWRWIGGARAGADLG